MCKNITEDLASKVRYLIWCGKPQQEIAKKLSISGSSVSKICNGKWRSALARDYHPTVIERKNIERCKGCGHLVYVWPCLGCELKKERDK